MRMTNIAFIGLGVMGSPMAVRLAKAGHQVTGYNRTSEKTAALVEAGAARRSRSPTPSQTPKWCA
ncbi:NAD binding domain of 6-phosphogluconate dehydrogenase family protein [Mycobacterium xenopi 4042]|uniref:NAD binding domain of 6-phosphogluconate dehydrogenase family protein n=1 Tax=Mycobacterium xenopi 4042 TaxID=1299334 RepID=X7ZVP2_MYCXE|nr:NAD binding domain of 6-phosphogluconate dehydrogenase family protein [Mycobacterium xenopi 4042]EUA52006.1 NAD binding domain of 6-phosphogluconate dehydrogenase family protein [Mycobacterium xenopi 3993]